MALRVLIIDGHPAIGRGLQSLLGSMPELDVVGVSDCPVRGLWLAVRTPPDVALVDAEMPGLCSSAVIRLLRARSPETRVIALGVYEERRATALEAGADAFLLKDAGYEALWSAIRGAPLPQQSGPGSRQIGSHPDHPPRRPSDGSLP